MSDRRLARTRRMVAWSGFGAVAVYVAATVLGGMLDPSYSHLRHPVSELISSHAPDRVVLGALFIGYNVGLLFFAVGLYRVGRRRATGRVAFVFLVAISLAGILLVTPFPQDPLGEPGTGAGAVHIALAALVAALTVAVAFLLGFAFRGDPARPGSSRFSFVMGFVILETGVIAGITAANGVAFLGLSERVTIGAFLVWVLGMSVYAASGSREPMRSEADP